MPSPSQIARLAALESRSPAITNPMYGRSASEIRAAILGLMESIGTGPDDRILVWAQTAPDSDMLQFRDGQKPDTADWWR